MTTSLIRLIRALSAPAHGGSRIFRYTPFEIPEISMQLVECKTESKEAFYRVARQIACNTLAAKRGDLRVVAAEGRIDSVKRRRVALCDECRAAPASKVGHD